MTEPWRILVVDDQADNANLAADIIRDAVVRITGAPAVCETECSFDRALSRLSEQRFDFLVLDVRGESTFQQQMSLLTDYPGGQVFKDVRSRRFLPIIFYTALPDQVESLVNPPFTLVVSKIADDSVYSLGEAVRVVLDSGLPRLVRSLGRHVESVTQEFMSDFVEQHWSEFDGHDADLAHLLLRRLGVTLELGADGLAAELGYEAGETPDGVVHATRYYVVPPSGNYRAGDILRDPNVASATDSDNREVQWYIVLTPSCDFVPNRRAYVRAEYVVLVRCRPLEEFREFESLVHACHENPNSLSTPSVRRPLELLLRSRPAEGRQEDRYHYLPAAWHIPDLIVDNQRIIHVPRAELERYERVASLDSPYAEAFTHRFSRYLGRLGTPDLNIEAAIRRMLGQAGSSDDDPAG